MRAETVEAMAAVRRRTFDLVGHLSPAELERQVDPIMSPLVWDLAHIAAYEDLWLVHRFAGAPLLRPELAARYDAFETPRTVRGEIELLDTGGAREYLDSVRERALDTLDGREPDPVIHEMVIRHELQHTETMRQAMELGGLLPPGEAAPPPRPAARRRAGAAPRARGRLRRLGHDPGRPVPHGRAQRRVLLRQRAPRPRGR